MLVSLLRAAALASALLTSPAIADDLRPSLKAPEIKVAEWLKGKPFEGYQNSELTVVEFWATWCDPCIEMMPHLTELAKKHEGKVAFYGVSVREGEVKNLPEKLKTFMTTTGQKMGYNVARDTPDNFMARTWLDAASQFTIPSTFVVDKQGILIWIGHPNDLGKVIDQSLAGTFDRKAVAKEFQERTAATRRFVALMTACDEAEALYLSGKKAEGLAKLDAAEAGNDNERAMKKISRLQMFMYEPEKASKYVDEIAKQRKKADGWALVQLAHVLKPDCSPEMKAVALRALDKGVSLDPKNPNILLIAGNGWMKHGNKKKALEMAIAGEKWLPTSEFKNSEDTKKSLAKLRESAAG